MREEGNRVSEKSEILQECERIRDTEIGLIHKVLIQNIDFLLVEFKLGVLIDAKLAKDKNNWYSARVEACKGTQVHLNFLTG